MSHHHVHVAIVLGSDGKLGDSSIMCTSPVELENTGVDGNAAAPRKPTTARLTKDKNRAIILGAGIKYRRYAAATNDSRQRGEGWCDMHWSISSFLYMFSVEGWSKKMTRLYKLKEKFYPEWNDPTDPLRPVNLAMVEGIQPRSRVICCPWQANPDQKQCLKRARVSMPSLRSGIRKGS